MKISCCLSWSADSVFDFLGFVCRHWCRISFLLYGVKSTCYRGWDMLMCYIDLLLCINRCHDNYFVECNFVNDSEQTNMKNVSCKSGVHLSRKFCSLLNGSEILVVPRKSKLKNIPRCSRSFACPLPHNGAHPSARVRKRFPMASEERKWVKNLQDVWRQLSFFDEWSYIQKAANGEVPDHCRIFSGRKVWGSSLSNYCISLQYQGHLCRLILFSNCDA